MERTVHKIWGKIKPFTREEDKNIIEHLKDNPDKDGIDRFTDVTEPELHFFPASGAEPHPAVLVFPGGGYSHLAWSHEGLDIASFLNLQGFSAFVLKYRCPGRREAAHADAARSMRFIRFHAERFGIDPEKVGVIGFSAGGHLAATISAPASPVPYPETGEEMDKENFKPDFSLLIYPAYLVDVNTGVPAPEFKIDSSTPPAFLLQAEDDFVGVENTLYWYLNLKKAGVKAEMHLYAEGRHGYGLLQKGFPVCSWGTLAAKWLEKYVRD
ncbi:MAG: alpha/beta hydrolase [Lentisphaeria bacterium]|nr:alpha/beta hydrolase [Lentisphaeria bacterium]